MDGFDKKREVVKHLLGVLKGHAVGEVEGGLKQHEPPMEKAEVPEHKHSEMPSSEKEESHADEHKRPETKEEDDEDEHSSFMGLMNKVKK